MIETLLTVPPCMAEFLSSSPAGNALRDRLAWPRGGRVFVTSDPEGKKLGSGGGTVHLLWRAWQASGVESLDEWLAGSQKLVMHAGGESRRLPAYASIGKIFLPLPMQTGMDAQRFDQMLCDFQAPAYSRALEEAGPEAAVLITAGDVLLEFDPLAIPPVHADITGVGMRVSAEVARDFGVFFVRNQTRISRADTREIAFFLQKPSTEEIHARSNYHDFFVDTGMWLLSARAVKFLFRRCGWIEEKGFATPDELPSRLDLYTDVGTQLGKPDTEFTAGVIPLENAKFHHLGSSRQLFESLYDLQANQHTSRRCFFTATPEHAVVAESKRPVWADCIGAREPVRAQGANVLTGFPPESRIHHVPENVCVDIVPLAADAFCLRVYLLDDTGRGRTICGCDAGAWLDARGLPANAADVFELNIYPVLRAHEITQEWLDWFLAEKPEPGTAPEFLSARKIQSRVNLERYFAQRIRGQEEALTGFFQACLQKSIPANFDQDFKVLAAFVNARLPDLKEWILLHRAELADKLFKVEHRARFELFVNLLGGSGNPFDLLREKILECRPPSKNPPQLTLKEDQIVWARSPLRLDLAGGWTDTPPFCFERGGDVLNLAVLLNGQPPAQVFVRPIKERVLRIKSIDLGSSETIDSHGQLADYRSPESSFALAKAALALAGFDPCFQTEKKFPDLSSQLEFFGAGLELTMLCAVPKGSGLGTSSVLAATLLGALNRACGLGWDRIGLYQQVIAMEQLLTTGGGWQDQAGALFPGMKLIQTSPGLGQIPSVRFLPQEMIAGLANRTWLLYYTGITRLAKNILAEIVTDMFLGRQETRLILSGISANARRVYEAIQTGDLPEVVRGVRRSWRLNTLLDPETTNPLIEAILSRCSRELAAWKLLGAGGGGYLLMCCKDELAASRVRALLESEPPNPRARFVDFTVASQGLEVTVS